ncbi:hypothetical protein [Sorangium sp. So ce204]|uniref:hypothetical protein n=1 Tax=Sorangium sp. So ce204 TaxID=3133288 RepID=UPI003F625FA2
MLKYLQRKQTEVDGGKDARATWEQARPTKKIGQVVATLKRMTGVRARCMYCEDSRGTDIDHFRPLVLSPDKAFLWANLLWNCTDCGRHKSAQFPVDHANAPLLINPTAEDPWDFLFYDTGTGNLAARFDPNTRQAVPKGRQTLGSLGETLQDEAVVDGRRRTQRNLSKAVRTFLHHPDLPGAVHDLLESVRDNDAYGLTRWYFLKEGREEAPFSELRAQHHDVWIQIEGSIT